MNIQNETKEVAVVREKVGNALEVATSVAKSIKSDTDYEKANETLVNVKKVGKLITQEKKKQLDPINAAAKATRDFWRPFENQYVEAEKVLKEAVSKYKAKIDARNARKEATISKNVEEGKVSFEKGAEKMQTLQAQPTTHAGVKTRMVKKVRFAELLTLKAEDISLLIDKGLIVWNEVEARKQALAGVTIPGAEVYEEEVLVV